MRISLGIIARRGLSLRNGDWDADAGTPPGSSPEFVSDDQNAMTDFTYMADAVGNIRGLIDSATDTAKLPTFDAFGNNIGGYISLRAASDCNYQDTYDAHCGLPIDPPNPAEPAERMQAGAYSWRGGEGSQTDLNGDDRKPPERVHDPRYPENPNAFCCDESEDTAAIARSQPATGLVYMVNRFYEPETGRITQPDLLDFDPVQIASGQNNRWVYAANDPVGNSDPRGLNILAIAVIIVLVVLFFALVSGAVSASGGGSFWAGAAGGAVTGLATVLSVLIAPGSPGIAAAILVLGSGLGPALTGYLNGNAFDAVIFDFVVGAGVGGLGLGAAGGQLDDLIIFFLGLDGSLIVNCFAGLRGLLT